MTKKKEPAKKKEKKDELKHTPENKEISSFKEVAEQKANAEASPEKPPVKKRHRRTRAEIEAEKDTLTEEPNALLMPILEIPFNAWAAGVGDERFRLSDVEKYNLALSMTQIMEYYFPKAKSIYFAWFTLLFQGYQVFTVRQGILKEIRVSRGLDPKTGKPLKPKPPEAPPVKGEPGYHDESLRD